MSQHKKFRRRRKLVDPGLQLRLTFTFVGVSALALLLQFILFASAVNEVALALPQDGPVLLEKTSGMLFRVLGTSFLVFLPITFVVGILSTFRIAGPLYRFKSFLGAIQRGEKPADFRLRKGDEFVDVAELLNSVTAPLRRAEGEKGAAPATADAVPSLVSGDEDAEAARAVESSAGSEEH